MGTGQAADLSTMRISTPRRRSTRTPIDAILYGPQARICLGSFCLLSQATSASAGHSDHPSARAPHSAVLFPPPWRKFSVGYAPPLGMKDARAVIADLTPVRREVHRRKGRWYDLRMRPYRTVDDKIDGVVITFVDVSERKAMEERLKSLLAEAPAASQKLS